MPHVQIFSDKPICNSYDWRTSFGTHLDLDGDTQHLFPRDSWLHLAASFHGKSTTTIPHQTSSNRVCSKKCTLDPSISIGSEHCFPSWGCRKIGVLAHSWLSLALKSALYHLVCLAFLHLPRLVGARDTRVEIRPAVIGRAWVDSQVPPSPAEICYLGVHPRNREWLTWYNPVL